MNKDITGKKFVLTPISELPEKDDAYLMCMSDGMPANRMFYFADGKWTTSRPQYTHYFKPIYESPATTLSDEEAAGLYAEKEINRREFKRKQLDDLDHYGEHEACKNDFLAGITHARSSAREVARLKYEVDNLSGWVVLFCSALKELCDLKRIKDSEGKTTDYNERQPKAWDTAFQYMQLWRASDGGAKDLKTLWPISAGEGVLLDALNNIIGIADNGEVTATFAQLDKATSDIVTIASEALASYQSTGKDGWVKAKDWPLKKGEYVLIALPPLSEGDTWSIYVSEWTGNYSKYGPKTPEFIDMVNEEAVYPTYVRPLPQPPKNH